MKNTIVGVDLAKKVIQVCKTTNRTVRSNEEMTPHEFTLFLVKSKPMTVVFERVQHQVTGNNKPYIMATMQSLFLRNL